ncbi:Crp/Fnr family transcriptional regulator [Leptolyngbya sp. NIES-2104]|uniref:Crp/Fnr family transcriptional regulator n=1 Tax=Leptolyngbya sp. NIES-2104 TaxID=1552121 RepID=UPI0006ECB5EE|nr:Crp/Fnr family transcriptional regulator [Leptolyngbya sp. NIES-2104]GAP94170.1 cAMP-binding protein - catabolite gene activator and regulatory subunit of cAMP-dependent protein kinase [Leptolyngbya sp. NIES-2104]
MHSTVISRSLIQSEIRLFKRRSTLPLRQISLWRIESGVVRMVTWLEDGSTVTLGLCGAGDVVGTHLSAIEPYQIECLTDVEATPLSPDEWFPSPEQLLARVQQAEEFMLIRSHRRVEEMLLKLLTWLGKKFGRKVSKGHLIELRLTHQDIAELLGTTRVTITRVLKQFEQQGIVQRLPNHLTLLQPDAVWHYDI